IIDVALDFLLVPTIARLKNAGQTGSIAVDYGEIIVGQLAPLPLQCTLPLFPVSLHHIPVHTNSFPFSTGPSLVQISLGLVVAHYVGMTGFWLYSRRTGGRLGGIRRGCWIAAARLVRRTGKLHGRLSSGLLRLRRRIWDIREWHYLLLVFFWLSGPRK